MIKSAHSRGIFLVAIFALAAISIANLKPLEALGISPLIVGIVLGGVYGNTLRHKLDKRFVPGIEFSAKKILRLGVILYGFNITFAMIASIGFGGFFVDLFMVVSTIFFGVILGRKLLGLDRDSAILTSSGAAICGAAAVLATESVLKSKPYKTSIAVATVVVFGTLSMFLYPFLIELSDSMTKTGAGIYIGASVHEVAHVVAASAPLGEDVANDAVISKMTRVVLLFPFLIALGIYISRKEQREHQAGYGAFIPWFGILFLGVVALNSAVAIDAAYLAMIREFDLFLLTMAMSALGMETNLKKFKEVGKAPFVLGFLLFLWLLVAGFIMTKLFVE